MKDLSLSCFKAYDIRGKVPSELNTDIAYRIGRAFAMFLNADSIAVGYDIRLTSPELAAAVREGIVHQGCDVIDLGQCGTEETYFAAFTQEIDGAIIVTASHNPIDYNGMKLVKTGAVPISSDTGLNEIQAIAESGKFDFPKRLGKTGWRYSKSEYIEHLLEYVNPSRLKPLKIVVNAGNGAAGPVLDLLEKHLPFEFIKLHHKPDGHFPNGIPNPLLIENRKSTSEAVIKHKADLGLAWDGDFDRCFFFDEQGAFISGYYMVGLLAVYQLAQGPNSTILHDPRLTWNSIDLIESAGGKAKESRTGHAFFKEKMRSENAIYGGEISAHHYFKKFAYADSGMIPWLLISQMLSANGKTMSSLISERKKLFPSSDELNFKVKNPDYLIKAITDHYKDDVVQTNQTDGYGLEFKRWRFNLRQSNTEPLIRLNIETREDLNLLNEKISELSKLIQELDVA